jgi:hypothetical protein
MKTMEIMIFVCFLDRFNEIFFPLTYLNKNIVENFQMLSKCIYKIYETLNKV